jgi:hypothetical protein
MSEYLEVPRDQRAEGFLYEVLSQNGGSIDVDELRKYALKEFFYNPFQVVDESRAIKSTKLLGWKYLAIRDGRVTREVLTV